jgi:hypothetical protein
MAVPFRQSDETENGLLQVNDSVVQVYSFPNQTIKLRSRGVESLVILQFVHFKLIPKSQKRMRPGGGNCRQALNFRSTVAS